MIKLKSMTRHFIGRAVEKKVFLHTTDRYVNFNSLGIC